MFGALLVSGTLLLSPSHPLRVPAPGPSVWFSNPKALEVQNLGRALVLHAKAPGLVHAFGLRRGSERAERLQSVSEETYAAATRCPRARLDWGVSPPRPLDFSDPALAELFRCGFEALSLPENPDAAWERRLGAAEARLGPTGLRPRGQGRGAKQRELTLGTAREWALPRARRALGAFFPFFAFTFTEGARPGRTIVFEVSLFEFSRAKAASLGLRWPEHVSVKGWAGSAVAGGTGLEIGADFGESLGVGRVLARPQIRTKPGEKAIFQSGGEIPIRHPTPFGSQTSWKNYGLMLTLEPEAQVETGAGELTVGFRLELSEPDPSTAVDGVPGMRVRRLESRFDLRAEETTILTTLIQTRRGTLESGLPGLRETPFAEALFGRKERTEQDAELWFAIRPSWEEIR